MCGLKQEQESFETALEKLEAIVHDLEEGDVALQTLLEKYTQGALLVKYCLEQLDYAEKAMDVVLKEENGQLQEAALKIEGE